MQSAREHSVSRCLSRHALSTVITILLGCSTVDCVAADAFLKSIEASPDQSQVYIFRNGASCIKRADYIKVVDHQKTLSLLSVFKAQTHIEEKVQEGLKLTPTFEEIQAARFSVCFEYGNERMNKAEYNTALATYEVLTQDYVKTLAKAATSLAKLSLEDVHFDESMGDVETFPVLDFKVFNPGNVALIKRAEFWVEKTWVWKPFILPYSVESVREYNVLLPVSGTPYKVTLPISQAIDTGGIARFRATIGNDGPAQDGTTRYVFLFHLKLFYNSESVVATNDLMFVSYPPADVVSSTRQGGDYAFKTFVTNRSTYHQWKGINAQLSPSLAQLIQVNADEYLKPIEPTLEERLGDSNPKSVVYAASFLGFLGKEADAALPKLVRLAESRNTEIQKAAAAAVLAIRSSKGALADDDLVRVSDEEWSKIPSRLTKEVLSLDAEALNKLALRSESSKKYDDAIAYYSRAIRKDPKNVRAYLGRCYCELQNENYDASVSDCEVVTKTTTDLEEQGNAYYNIGVAKGYNIGQEGAALGFFEQALQADPQLDKKLNVRSDRAHIKEIIGDLPGAADDLTRHLSYHPHDDDALAELGRVYYLLGDKTKAVLTVKAAIDIKKDEYYYKIWYVALGGQKDVLTLDSDKSSWPHALASFMLDQSTEDELLRQAQSGSFATTTVAQRLCEAYTYIGLKDEAHGNMKLALESYKRAVETKVNIYIEYRWSLARVKQNASR